jgi:hypothetical protein
MCNMQHAGDLVNAAGEPEGSKASYDVLVIAADKAESK